MSVSSIGKVDAINKSTDSTPENTSQVVTLPFSTSSFQTSPLPGDRPITASTFEISDTVNLLGIRPIAASEIQVSETINLHGIRPIAASELQVSKTITTSGIRPIASNKIEKIDELIGYLD